jgi:hypothetical protein
MCEQAERRRSYLRGAVGQGAQNARIGSVTASAVSRSVRAERLPCGWLLAVANGRHTVGWEGQPIGGWCVSIIRCVVPS